MIVFLAAQTGYFYLCCFARGRTRLLYKEVKTTFPWLQTRLTARLKARLKSSVETNKADIRRNTWLKHILVTHLSINRSIILFLGLR